MPQNLRFCILVLSRLARQEQSEFSEHSDISADAEDGIRPLSNFSGLLGMPRHFRWWNPGLLGRFVSDCRKLGGVNRHQHCIGDTMLMRSPGGASIVVNAGFSVGDTEPGESKANKMYEPWRGSGVIMTVQTNSLPQPNPSRVRYRGSSL